MQTHSPLFSCRKPLIDYSCLSYTFNLEAFSSYLWLTIWHMRARVTFIHPLACFHPPHPHSHPPSNRCFEMGNRSLYQGQICLQWFGYQRRVQSLPLQFPSQCWAWSKINYTDIHRESWHLLSRSDSPLSHWKRMIHTISGLLRITFCCVWSEAYCAGLSV